MARGLILNKITSLTNEKIKFVVKLHQKKYRDELNLFIVEGFKAFEELEKSDFEIETVFLNEKFVDEVKLDSEQLVICSSDVMKKISTTESDAPILAIAKQKKYDISEFQKFNKIVLLDNIKDAGNLGTIIRSSLAFGFDGILLTQNSVDIYNSKVIRSSVGTFFNMPISYIDEKIILKDYFKEHKTLVTVVSGAENTKLDDIKDKKIICAFGSEADGISEHFIKQADYKITLPMQNDVESLNLSACASIVLYELSEN